MRLKELPKLLFASSEIPNGNMSLLRGTPEDAIKNRINFLNKYGIDLDQIVGISPQHGTEIIFVGNKDLKRGAFNMDRVLKVDGLITNKTGVFLFLTIADCLPVGLYDPNHQTIGLIHAGRQGLEDGILDKAVKIFQSNYHSSPSELVAEIGPSIGPCCYMPAYPDKSSTKLKPYINKYGTNTDFSIDLWSFAEDQLLEAGLIKENIYNPQVCTYHSGKYYSHRKYELEKLPEDLRFATIFGIRY